MAELVDAYGSGPYVGDYMEVRVLLSAPRRLSSFEESRQNAYYSKISSDS